MGLRYEAWTLPWSGDLVRTVAHLPVPEGAGRGAKVFVSTAGEGSIELNADQFARVGDVISDTVGSLIRVYDEATLIDEWLAERNGHSHDDTKREFSIGGPTMPGAMDKFFVPAFDYPANPSNLSDWIYDGESSLSDGGFEGANIHNETYEIDTDGATGGSFVLHLDGDSTAAIAWDASESTVAAQVESLTGITEVLVTASGERFTIEFFNPISPENEGLGLLTWTPSLTGGGGDETLDRIDAGLISPSGTWTTSQYADASNDPTKHGTYASDGFRLTEGAEPVHSGTYAARINGLSQFAGIQQLVQVEPNARYQASIWFYSSDATETFRLVMRDRYDTLIEWVNVTNATPNTWTLVELDFVTELPDGTGVDEIIFRFAQTQDHNPSPFYVDDAALKLGAPAATPGEITSDLYGAIAELAWLDITSFSDTLDSSSVAWTAEHSFVASWGETIGQVLDKFVDLGYEWDIVPKATPTGTPNVDQKTHDLVIYNQGNMDNAPAVAINVGQGVTGGEVVKRIPSYTSVLVEGAEGLFAEAEDSGAVTNFGTLRKFFSARHLADQTSLDQYAAQLLTSEAANRTAVQFNLVASDDHARPLVDYLPGDTIPMQLPPLLPKEDRRVQRIDYINTFPTQYTVTGSRIMRGEAAAMELIRRLWRRFIRPERDYRSGGVQLRGGTGYPITIAASNSFDLALADFVCAGIHDEDTIQSILDGRDDKVEIYFLPGDYYISQSVILPGDGDIKWTAAPGAIFHVIDGIQFINTNNCDLFRLDGGEYMGNPGSDGNISFIGGGTELPNEYTDHIINGAYFHDIHCSFLLGGSYSGYWMVTENIFEAINLHQSGGGFTQGAILGYQEPSNDHVWGVFANNTCRLITKTVITGFSAYIVYTEDVGKASIAIGNQVFESTDLDGYWGDTTVGVHNMIDNVHDIGDHSDLWTEPEFLTHGTNIQNFSQAGNLETGTGSFKLPFTLDATIVAVRLGVGTSPTGANLIVDVNKNGTTIYTTQANRPIVTAGDADGIGAETVPDVTAITAGEYLTVDIDQIGSTIPGADLTVSIEWMPA